MINLSLAKCGFSGYKVVLRMLQGCAYEIKLGQSDYDSSDIADSSVR
jgi:hypothetical protein